MSFYSPWNEQKTYSFLMISGRIEIHPSGIITVNFEHTQHNIQHINEKVPFIVNFQHGQKNIQCIDQYCFY